MNLSQNAKNTLHILTLAAFAFAPKSEAISPKDPSDPPNLAVARFGPPIGGTIREGKAAERAMYDAETSRLLESLSGALKSPVRGLRLNAALALGLSNSTKASEGIQVLVDAFNGTDREAKESASYKLVNIGERIPGAVSPSIFIRIMQEPSLRSGECARALKANLAWLRPEEAPIAVAALVETVDASGTYWHTRENSLRTLAAMAEQKLSPSNDSALGVQAATIIFGNRLTFGESDAAVDLLHATSSGRDFLANSPTLVEKSKRARETYAGYCADLHQRVRNYVYTSPPKPPLPVSVANFLFAKKPEYETMAAWDIGDALRQRIDQTPRRDDSFL